MTQRSISKYAGVYLKIGTKGRSILGDIGHKGSLNKEAMTIYDLINTGTFKVVYEGDNQKREITAPYCCDLLSFAMGRMPAGAAWVTVMGNVNTLAVATLADAACILLAEGSSLDEAAARKAKEQGITVLLTDLPIFDAALIIYQGLHA